MPHIRPWWNFYSKEYRNLVFSSLFVSTKSLNFHVWKCKTCHQALLQTLTFRYSRCNANSRVERVNIPWQRRTAIIASQWLVSRGSSPEGRSDACIPRGRPRHARNALVRACTAAWNVGRREKGRVLGRAGTMPWERFEHRLVDPAGNAEWKISAPPIHLETLLEKIQRARGAVVRSEEPWFYLPRSGASMKRSLDLFRGFVCFQKSTFEWGVCSLRDFAGRFRSLMASLWLFFQRNGSMNLLEIFRIFNWSSKEVEKILFSVKLFVYWKLRRYSSACSALK